MRITVASSVGALAAFLAGRYAGWAGLGVVAVLGAGAWYATREPLAEAARLSRRVQAILRGERGLSGDEAETAPDWSRAFDRVLQELAHANAEKHELAEEIRSHSFEDRLTGLGNRHFFDSRFEVFAQAREEASGGAVLLLQLRDLAELTVDDEAQSDDILRQVAVLLEGATRDLDNVVLARRGPLDFAVLVPLFPPTQLPALATKLVRAACAVSRPNARPDEDLVHVGVAQYRAGDEPYAVLAQADMALRTAQLQGPNSWYMYEQGQVPSEQVRGSVRWRTLLESALERRRLVVHYQGVYAADGHVLHYEAFSRLPDEGGELIKAAVFLPMARSLGLAPQLDRLAVDIIIKDLLMGRAAESVVPISINLSAESLISNTFVTWLRTRLVDHPKLASRLMFEFDEYAVARQGELLAQPFQHLRELGCRIAVDHVGLAITRAVYLTERRFDCVKLHSSIVRSIDQAPPNQLFVRSLHSLCVEGKMQLLAEGIETETEWHTLLDLGVAGGQGYFLGEPKSTLEE